MAIWVVFLSRTEFIPRTLTPLKQVNGIRSLVRFGKRVSPLADPVLYLHDSFTRG